MCSLVLAVMFFVRSPGTAAADLRVSRWLRTVIVIRGGWQGELNAVINELVG